MDGSERSRDTRASGQSADEDVAQVLTDRDLVMRFQSLGGTGHGPEFAIFQHTMGAEPDGLLARADLGYEALVAALESRFDGVGLPENTIVFTPDHSDEWWTKDTRYWMAMRSFVRTDEADLDRATQLVCSRLQSLRRKLIEDLRAGEKIFVYKNMLRNLTPGELGRLHGAVRAYGDSTLFYVRYADETHPPGTVESGSPGLLIGYIDHFRFSPDNRQIGSVDDAWLQLCERAFHLCAAVSATPPPLHPPVSIVERSADANPPADLAPADDHPPVEPALIEDPAPAGQTAREPQVTGRRPIVRRGRQIVLIGNCQVQAMAGLYRRFVAGRTGDSIEYVASYQDLSDESRGAIQRADLVVEQLFDLKQRAETDALPTTIPRLFIPMVTAAFLWPFSGSPHPKNSFHPFLTGGPYGGESADSYLNRLIMSGTDPQEAVEIYANLDVNSRVNLDRLFELVMDRQRSRDEAAGYQIADIMERHFRTEQIFLSPYHPNVRIATALASEFFAQLGAQRDEIDRMVRCTRITPFPKGELPFHPSVCRHFGLEFVGPDRRYRFLNEGLFTFREYALRYMRYEWNDALEEGLHLVHIGRPDDARERLTVGLQRSPMSAAGHNALSHVLARQGEPEAALASIRRAVEIEPESAPYRSNLGTQLGQNRRLDDAVAELRQAIALDPGEPHYRVLLAHLMRQRGDLDAACGLIREALELDPYSAKLRADLANFLEARGELEGAAEAMRDALAMQPENEEAHYRLAHILGRLNRVEEAIEIARDAVRLAPESTRARLILSDLLLRRGDPADALNEAYTAAVSEPDSAHAYGHLGHVLDLVGDLPAAEAAFRRAAKLDPRNAHFRHEISTVLGRQKRFPEAIKAAREAAELETRNPHRRVHLANLLTQSGDVVAAQAAQRAAVELEPDAVGFRVGLSDLFARNGQLGEALTEAAIAVEYHPKNVHAMAHLAHIALLRGEYDRADEILRRALEIEPRNESLLRRAAALQARRAQAVAV